MKREEADTILRFNKGFSNTAEWVEYAIENNFNQVNAELLHECPDCGSSKSSRLGQFIYYSSLIQLNECLDCKLIWTNTRIDSSVIQKHFGSAYKNREYFQIKRRWIFSHSAEHIASVAPTNGKILDIGGAQGDLMNSLRLIRPDITAHVSDTSTEALDHAKNEFGFVTFCNDLSQLKAHSDSYDTIVLSDVLYYERDIRSAWDTISALLKDDGSVVIRIPNKLFLIRSIQLFRNLFSSREKRRMQSAVYGFNCEHVYIFCREYYTSRLERAGFGEISVFPSPPLADTGTWPRRFLLKTTFKIISAIATISGGRIILSPSQLIVATRSR